MARTTPLDAALASYMPWLRDRAAAVAPADEPRPVTFPTSPLTWKVEIALGANLSASWASWAWTDITAYVLLADGINWSTGRKDEHSLVEAGQCSMTLNNSDGRFSRRNPNSPYYGLLTKNTPIRVSVDPGSGFVTVIQMFVNNWPKRSDKTGTFITSPIQGAGIMRRLGQGQVAKSALRRFFDSLSTAPIAYLPFEDTTTAVRGTFAQDLAASAVVNWAQDGNLAGSQSLPSISLGSGAAIGAYTLSGFCDASSSSNDSWSFTLWQHAILRNDRAADCTSTITLNMNNSPQIGTWFITIRETTSVPAMQVDAFAKDNTGTTIPVLDTTTINGTYVSDWQFVRVTVDLFGGSHRMRLYLDETLITTNTQAGYTPGQPVGWKIQSQVTESSTPISIGHLAIASGAGTDILAANATQLRSAGLGYVGEQAHTRIKRVCGEDSIPIYCVGANSTAMGAQGVNTTLDILREAEASDLGVLYETGFGFGYQLRSDRYNAPVALALDFAQAQFDDPPGDDDDDQLLRNQWTITRNGGVTKTASDTANIAANGLYADSATVSLYHDGLTSDAAHWRVHLGIVDQERWPALSINFASAGGQLIVSQWLALGYGVRLQIANPPTTYLAEPLDVFVEGQASKGDPFSLRTEFNTTPFSPYVVLTQADAANPKSTDGREAHPGSTLTLPILAGDLSIAVTNSQGSWGIANLPYDIRIGGERVTVTAVSGSGTSQTLTVTRAVNGVVRGWDAGTQLQIVQTFAAALWGA